ncbi:hypothetical protein BAE44_0023506 [Dichanthelium oligosanthes]|uniref:Uncharacterized protein n=1 Tax=Dichanthelium oligosanthes TaxID=888268 RepID=A0A1E5URP5_9POAL|nr:hypothetical protein BAE44_0023506 [Dichanthelium oligosanthes]
MSGAPAAVSVLAISRVVLALPPAEYAEPVKVKLSFLDAPFAATPPIQHEYLYKLAGGDDEYPAAVTRLKESLATVLGLYLPLAGELRYMPDTRDVIVDCSDAGVSFVEAEAKRRRMDIVRLTGTGNEAQDIPAFLSLVPEHDARDLPASVLSLRATRLHGAGLGTSVHHAVVVLVDGRAVQLFLHCRPIRRLTTSGTYFVGADDVQLLKRLIGRLVSAGDDPPKPAVSTFVALVALGWTGIGALCGRGRIPDLLC